VISKRGLKRTVFVALWCCFATILAAQTPPAASAQENNGTQAMRQAEVATLKTELQALNKQIEEGSVWHKIYANHLTYNTIASKIRDVENEIERYKRLGARKYRTKIAELEDKKAQLQEQLDLLKDYAQNPFKALLKPKEIEKVPTVTNPIAIIGAFSFMKQMTEQLQRFEEKIRSLEIFVDMLQKKSDLLKKMIEAEPSNLKLQEMLSQTLDELSDADEALELHKTALVIYKKKVDEIKLRLTDQIKEQAKKAGTIGMSIFFLLLIVLFFKWLAKRTISDNERFYMANKIINFSFVFIVAIILMFAYIENVSYLVTVLGFASAGIAIAMKDWFMSMLGWLVIVLGGSIHVGDRIRVDRDGKKYVGDVMDISLLRMTIFEDITLTTYEHNRRAGRIIFIPNNYIFTDMIANYSHATLKTVWDGIDFTITFNSNHKKATHIARETARKYAKGYTDITRKQLNKLRARYNLKNTNVDPRVFTFIEENGIRVSVWYLTNAYATLTLRSTISAEILDLIKEEEDIVLAYPSQHIYLDQAKSKPTLPDLSEGRITV
jgi:small-conductance mechanosensitive channel